MKRISIKNPKEILKQEKDEYKYLSPHIYFDKKNYFLAYCNRKSPKKFYGEINFAKSNDLKKWKKIKNLSIKPKPKKIYRSYLSPAFINLDNKNYILLEGQKKIETEIKFFSSKNNIDWKDESLKFGLKKKNNLYQSPVVFKDKGKLFLFFSYNRNEIRCLILNNKFKKIKSISCFKSSFQNELFSIYSPSIIKHNNKYYMFYAAWKDAVNGNINIAVSENLIKWRKIKKNIFKISKPISIVSEPFLFRKENNIFLFFEYKKKTIWNIAYKKLSLKEFSNLIN